MIALSYFSLQSCSTQSHLEHWTARIEAACSDMNHDDLSENKNRPVNHFDPGPSLSFNIHTYRLWSSKMKDCLRLTSKLNKFKKFPRCVQERCPLKPGRTNPPCHLNKSLQSLIYINKTQLKKFAITLPVLIPKILFQFESFF